MDNIMAESEENPPIIDRETKTAETEALYSKPIPKKERPEVTGEQSIPSKPLRLCKSREAVKKISVDRTGMSTHDVESSIDENQNIPQEQNTVCQGAYLITDQTLAILTGSNLSVTDNEDVGSGTQENRQPSPEPKIDNVEKVITDDEISPLVTRRSSNTNQETNGLAERRSQSLSALDHHYTPLPPPDSKPYYSGSDYLKVYPGDKDMNRDDDIGDEHTVDDNLEVSSASSSDDEVNVNTTIKAGVQHIHVHVNLNFTEEKNTRKQQKIMGRRSKRNKEKTSSSRKQKKSIDNKDLRTDDSKSKTASQEGPQILPKKLMHHPKTAKGKDDKTIKDKSTHSLNRKTSKSMSGSKDSDIKWPKFKEWFSSFKHPGKKPQTTEKETMGRDYDEIDFSDLDGKESKIGNRLQLGSVPQLDQQENSPQAQDKLPYSESITPWLFDHTAMSKAEEKIKNDQDGVFVVIQEDSVCNPFTPYTLLVVHDGQLKRIPFLKHRMNQRKIGYTLADPTSPKLDSIKDIVAFFQKNEIGDLKLKLRQP